MSFLSTCSLPDQVSPTLERFRYRRLRITGRRTGLRLQGLGIELKGFSSVGESTRPNSLLAGLVAAQLSRGTTVPFAYLRTDSFGEFQRDVYSTLSKSEAGERLTYGELAERSGYRGASQAVGQCLKKNPFPPLIPCHRVVRADGTPGGYQGDAGSDLKAYLLDLEKRLRSLTDF